MTLRVKRGGVGALFWDLDFAFREKGLRGGHEKTCLFVFSKAHGTKNSNFNYCVPGTPLTPIFEGQPSKTGHEKTCLFVFIPKRMEKKLKFQLYIV